MGRTYEDAVASLNTLQSNFAIVSAIQKSGRGMNKNAIPEMIEWVKKIGYEPSDFNKLGLIHIAGTKGKGSTSAFISHILSQYLPPASVSNESAPVRKIGLYTSPHLRFVRERIRINNEPLTEAQFARYFFETWDRLEESARKAGLPTDNTAKPVYFRFLTLMAFHTYMSEGVDATILECGIGGEYDSTNIIEKPAVAGITTLGIDHVAMLGGTLPEIAWHKAGIMKAGVPVFSVDQGAEAMPVLEKRAEEKGATLAIARRNPEVEKLTLGLAADFQVTNASLAVAVAAEFLRQRGVSDMPTPASSKPLPAPFVTGLEKTRWGGRCDKRVEGLTTWHIDGGHTLESIEEAGKWFASQLKATNSSATSSSQTPPLPSTRVLIFNQQTRDASALARALHKTLASALNNPHPFSHAIFCTNVTYKDSGYRPDLVSINTNASDVSALSVQHGLAKTWNEVDDGFAVTEVLATVEEAVEMAEAFSKKRDNGPGEQVKVDVLVTGSLHLVGGVLEVLESRKN